MAIKIGCDAANTASKTVIIPKIIVIAERIAEFLSFKNITPINPWNIIKNPTIKNWKDTRKDTALK